MNSTKFFDFFGKIREIIVILADIKSGTGNLITRLRKRPVHYLVVFLAGGAILDILLTQTSNSKSLLVVACGMAADYIAFWTLHSTNPILWPLWRTSKEAKEMPNEVTSPMMYLFNGKGDLPAKLGEETPTSNKAGKCHSDDDISQSSNSPSENLDTKPTSKPTQSPPPHPTNSNTDQLMQAIQKLLDETELPLASPLIAQLCSVSPTDGLTNEDLDTMFFMNVNSTMDALFGIEMGTTHITGGEGGLKLVLSWLDRARAHPSWAPAHDCLLDIKLERILDALKDYNC
ncbi:uncharacterized protein PGTG_17934 [Puccinia graminis f. sp. tritici CRL 75-36-700-3]|uniref:Uncharacterized protein n=1 Tax=Puccinia graminis f. sp. tritici (strain CRL 75-36-700-3 / race SCCL) TaxID=418459 RepID=E3L5T2_PUCGT|nr:uncharacterized protein PGTG_17934 [Puccinia graminis f. sp. tritici CRL 75-36-700-3]EFP91907.2 hypothetical protein PGTG_17934 [Puccinia graminis f. sp. tritici CRL 75-36-700-3]